MKRFLSLLLIAAMLLVCAAQAEGNWYCQKDGTANAGKYCSECGTAMAEASAWNCPKCGNPGLMSAFCPNCGTKRPEVKTQTNGTCEGAGFATPQEAATAYVEALAACDIPTALSTFAVETYVEHMDVDAFLRRIRSAQLSTYKWLPANSPLRTSIQIEQRRAELTKIMYYMYVFYFVYGTEYADLGENTTLAFKDDDEINAFIDFFDRDIVAGLLGRMQIKGAYLTSDPAVASLLPDNYDSEAMQNNRVARLAAHGGDELAEVIVVLDIDGMQYFQLMECVRYGNVWYNATVQSTIMSMLGLPLYMGGLMPYGY